MPPRMESPQFLEMDGVELVWPAQTYLPGYVDALERGWSPDNLRPETGREQLGRIREDADLFLAQQVNRDGHIQRVTLFDGTVIKPLPGYRLWIWDGAFCGLIGFRWQPGTPELPPHCLGHIGFSVVPWKRGRGYATRALELLLTEVRKEGLPYVELTTDVTNIISQRVIVANGGKVIEQFNKPEGYGGAPSLRFHIPLAALPPLSASP
jgi:predicted acetyltransferase